MSVAIVGDAHLSFRKYKEFEAKRFELLIDELIHSKANTIVFAGDLLDTNNPTLEEIQFLNRMLYKLLSYDKKYYIISGNHEALTSTTNVYDSLMEFDKAYVKDGYLFNLKHNLIAPDIRMIGWTSIQEAQHTIGSKVLITHLRANCGLLKEEYDIRKLSDCYKLVFMGDLHFRYSPFENVHYTSSPYSTKFNSSSTKGYGYILYKPESEEWEYVDLDLPCKLKLECDTKSLKKTIKGLDKHLLKVFISGTLNDLNNLPELSNVIYIKEVIDVSTVQIQTVKTNPLDTIEEHILKTDIVKRYPNSTEKITDKIKEIKDTL